MFCFALRLILVLNVNANLMFKREACEMLSFKTCMHWNVREQKHDNKDFMHEPNVMTDC